MRSRAATFVLPLLAALLGACPPPPDVEAPAVPDAPPKSAETGASGASGASQAALAGTPTAETPDGAPPATTSEASAAPWTSDGTQPVVYEKLRGGIHAARCPSCGEVQAKGAAKCPGCGQALSPWRHETLCTRCEGDGRCDRCGDDRVCLACDGDGACSSCDGSGRTPGAATKCVECSGGGRCLSCRGDGRREQGGGDFAASEGWLPGACPTCIDGSGLCPECGSGGKDRGGEPCATCGGVGACPDCGGTGECTACAGDGDCTVCEGGGREVRNGPPRGPDERIRALRTSAGAVLLARVEGPPTSQALRLVRNESGRDVQTTLPKTQLAPLSAWLVERDFPPGWDGRAVPEPADHSMSLRDLADAAAANGWWPLALRTLSASMVLDPARAPAARVKAQEVETKRADDWLKRAEAAVRAGEQDRATQLLQMVVFKGRGNAVATRAELQLLQTRKDREADAEKLDEAEKARRGAESKALADRAVARARLRLDRARRLLEQAGRAANGDATADRTFARSEWAAASARRMIRGASFRDPPAIVPWGTPPDAVVTESRLVSLSILEAWASRSVAGGRYDLGARTARRAIAIDPAGETARRILADAEAGLARTGVLLGSPPPERR